MGSAEKCRGERTSDSEGAGPGISDRVDGALGPCTTVSALEAGISPQCEAEATVSPGLTVAVCRCSLAREDGATASPPSPAWFGDDGNDPTTDAALSVADRHLPIDRLALICVTPEHVVTPEFARRLEKTRVHKILVDEAIAPRQPWRCSAQDRKFLQRLAQLGSGIVPKVLRVVDQPPGRRRGDGRTKSDTVLAISDIHRRGFVIEVEPRSRMPLAQLVSWFYLRRESVGVVYCLDQNEVHIVAGLLQGLGFAVTRLYNKLTDEQRMSEERAFASGQTDIAVVQSGQGRRLTRPDIDSVLHTGMPFSLQVYLEDIEVANRAGTCPKCTILYSPQDAEKWSRRLGAALGHSSSASVQLRHMEALCRVNGCRHLAIMRYLKPGFALQNVSVFWCHQCDNCLRGGTAMHDDGMDLSLA